MDSPKSPRKIFEFALIFLALYLVTELALRTFFPTAFGGAKPPEGVELRAQDATVKDGHHPILLLKNHTNRELTLPSRCPSPPVDVYFAAEGEAKVEPESQLRSSGALAVPCTAPGPVPPGGTQTIDLGAWKYTLFGQFGSFIVSVPDRTEGFPTGSGMTVARFTLHEAGPVTKLFRAFITRPFLNFLIFTAGILPSHSLGIAIILLTLLVKLLLFFPTQHALEGQKKMQSLQPRIEAIKKQHADAPAVLQQEMMKLWKENKVNPFQSCLPLLIQFPVLIGLFYTVRDGSTLALSRHLIYPLYTNLSWSFHTNFLWLDLLKADPFILPLSLAALQFLQMKLTFAMQKKRKKEKEGKEGKVEKEAKKPLAPDEIQQRVMLYALPLMIGFFAIQFPAAVSLYWGVSTLFAIGQQVVVNRKSA